MTLSFCMNFTPSATSWAQPWKRPAYIGPTRLCMCAICLCSIWPTSSGSVMNAPITRTHRSTTSRRSLIGGLASCTQSSGTPGGFIRRPPVRLATSWSDSPGSFAPGQALTTREASTNSLRSGWPSNPSGSSSGSSGSAEVDAEHLVGLALVPRGAGVDVGDGRHGGRLGVQERRDQQVVPRIRARSRCATRRNPSPPRRPPTASRSTCSRRRGARRACRARRRARRRGAAARTRWRRGSRRSIMGPPDWAGRVWESAATTWSARYRSARFSWAIWFCSVTMPCSSASGRGGQPGT